MKDLLAAYSGSEIVLFIFLLAVAIKEVVTFWEWAKSHLKDLFSKDQIQLDIMNKIKDNDNKFEDLSREKDRLTCEFKEMKRLMNILIESDKADIKAWITEKHHYYCYEKKYIDDYSLDCIEKRYQHYKEEGGNSFIESLIKEIRDLPKVVIDKE